MRFNENGPNIPDELLDKCDHGKVVLFCGAGVSFNSGLPSFIELTKAVIDFFSPLESSEVYQEFLPWITENSNKSHLRTPLDQIFHLLYQDYGRDEVNQIVARVLSKSNSIDDVGKEHGILKLLSSGQSGKPKIVTTNFDLLFEQNEILSYSEPPFFPDLSSGASLEAITYLHGRLKDPSEKHHPYILSSADFGRAYLSEGWATKFIIQLLEVYTVVLVGYQAEDPQVKYLLQGLNHDEKFDRTKIYAFDKGEAEDIEVKWRDRGVTAIAYPDHSDLWETLSIWSEKVDKPKKWISYILNLAASSPRQLKSFQRGQVANFLTTSAGAKLFSTTEPTPLAEWLCVFDPQIRIGNPSKGHNFRDSDGESFDPFIEYGLDDDPSRPVDKENYNLPTLPHKNYLSWLPCDNIATEDMDLRSNNNLISPRLWYITNWIVKNLDDPVIAWWAIRKRALHNALKERILVKLYSANSLPAKAQKILGFIASKQFESSEWFNPSHNYYRFQDLIKNEGWNLTTLRFYETKLEPFVEFENPYGIHASKPPLKAWSEIHLSDICNFEIKFPLKLNPSIEVPYDNLYRILQATLTHLEYASDLSDEFGHKHFYNTPSCYPDPNEDTYNLEEHSSFYFFIENFKRLVDKFPSQAKALSFNLNLKNSLYFNKLILYSFGFNSIFSASEAANYVLSIDLEYFWNRSYQLDLLRLLEKRWKDFSNTNKEKLVKKILDGPNKSKQITDEEFQIFKNLEIFRYIKWCELSQLVLPEKYRKKIDMIISMHQDWQVKEPAELVHNTSVKVHGITIDEEADLIINAPISEVIKRSIQVYNRGFEEYTARRPFDGLVKLRPKKALLALSYLSKRKDNPKYFWSVLLDNWPDSASRKTKITLLNRLYLLPKEILTELSYHLGNWLDRHGQIYLKELPNLCYKFFDHCTLVVLRGKQGASKSKETSLSHITWVEAKSSLTGAILNTYIQEIDSYRLDKDAEIPSIFKDKIEQFLISEDTVSAYASAILSYQISWLHYIDSSWVQSFLLPLLNLDNKLSGPAWSGVIANKLPSVEVSVLLKPKITHLFPKIYEWAWDQRLIEATSHKIIELALPSYKGKDKINASDAKNCFRNMREKERAAVIRYLSKGFAKNSNECLRDVTTIIESIWPRERKYRTKEQTSAWINLLEKSGSYFPNLFHSMEWCLTPLEVQHHWLNSFARNTSDSIPLASQFPNEVLSLCDLIIPKETRSSLYHLKEVLDLIEQANNDIVNNQQSMKLTKICENN